MKSPFYFIIATSLLIAACSLTPTRLKQISSPIDLHTSSKIYYYSDSERKIASLETEYTEDSGAFRYERKSNAIAKELAKEEVKEGNVCLRQLANDLETATRLDKIEILCASFFQEELEKAKYSSYSQKPQACSANVEIKRDTESLDLTLVFQLEKTPFKQVWEKRISSIGRIQEHEITKIASHRVILGEAMGWKELLKVGACSLNDEVLTKIQWDYLNSSNEREKLANCQRLQKKNLFTLNQLQKQFKQYVPDEWIQNQKTSFLNEIFQERTDESYSSYKTCRKYHRQTIKQLEKIAHLSKDLADKYKVTVLDPANWGDRSISSINDE